VLGAAREVDDATVSFVKDREQVVYLEQAVEAARRSLDIANVQYKEGLVDFERVLDSQRTLFSQEDRLVSTRGDVASSLIAFFKATGGGWQGHRGQPVLDERTRKEMATRSDWNTLIDAPLPRLDELVPPSVKETR
jgi:outer membrane protein TolC